tara:strand:- start:2417 stop:2602 length:186 start_codon:yes stop_codon:yes gene_type:complete
MRWWKNAQERFGVTEEQYVELLQAALNSFLEEPDYPYAKEICKIYQEELNEMIERIEQEKI